MVGLRLKDETWIAICLEIKVSRTAGSIVAVARGIVLRRSVDRGRVHEGM